MDVGTSGIILHVRLKFFGSKNRAQEDRVHLGLLESHCTVLFFLKIYIMYCTNLILSFKTSWIKLFYCKS